LRSAEKSLTAAPPFGIGSIDAEWRILLACASPGADSHQINEMLRQTPDWPALLALADEHGIISLLAARLRECDATPVPEEIRRKLQDRLRAQLVSTLSITAELFRLMEVLDVEDLETALVKGPALSMQAFGDPGLRQFGDLDLLVRHRDIRRATERMISAGYEAEVPFTAIDAGKIPGQYVFRRPNTKLLIELHTERTLRYFPRPLPIEEMFKRRIRVLMDGHPIPALAVEDELVLICIHGAKHFWERLMWIADVAALVTRQKGLSWAQAIARARAVDAERILNVGLLLAVDCLSARLPEEATRAIRSDSGAGNLVAQIRHWLPFAGYAPPGLLQRAMFRTRMRGGWLPGAAYLLRLSFSPTEEDWVQCEGVPRSRLMDALRRPWRLLRKYGRDGRT
jgi:Uncharacterised nucleotidyltransferase